MSAMPSDEMTTLSFNISRKKKRLLKMLAAKLDKDDVSALMIYLVDREINRQFSPETQSELLSSPAEDDESISPKARTGRRGKQAATG